MNEEFENEMDDDWGDGEEEELIEIEHTVMPGYEDIIVICAQYGITDWKQVCVNNNIKDPRTIKAGDIIILEKPEEDD